MKVIAIVGSRRRFSQDDYSKCEKKLLELYEPGDRIVSGGCPIGGDQFAERIAKKYRIPILIFYADWNIGKHAGMLRNTDIARECTHCVAIVAEDRTGGTEDTVKKVSDMGKPVFLL